METKRGRGSKNLTTYFYHQFVNVITASHPRLNKTKLVEEYGAKVFDGPTAERLGYIDIADSSYETVLADLLKEAKIDAAQPYQVIQILPKRNFWTNLAEGRSPLVTGKLKHQLQVNSDDAASFQDQFAYLYRPHG